MPKSEFFVEFQHEKSPQNFGQVNDQFRGQAQQQTLQNHQIRAATNEQIRRQFTCHNGMEVVEI